MNARRRSAMSKVFQHVEKGIESDSELVYRPDDRRQKKSVWWSSPVLIPTVASYLRYIGPPRHRNCKLWQQVNTVNISYR